MPSSKSVECQRRYSHAVKVGTRLSALLSCLVAAYAAQATTLNVTSPNEGDFLGKSNNVSITVRNADARVTVTVRLTENANPANSVTQQRDFTPNANGEINGTIPLNLSTSLASGTYTLRVSGTEAGVPLNVIPDRTVSVDVRDPKFLNFNPISGGFVRGLVTVSASFQEDNMKETRVQVANADIPNNTGTSNTVLVTWDSDQETSDGQKSITISAEDQAGNRATQNLNVTLDRLPPVTTILTPTGNEVILPGLRLAVAIEVADQFAGAVDERTIDVTLEDTAGNFLGRVARRTTRASGNTFAWSGRVRDVGRLPGTFDIVVNAADKAGNRASVQRVRVNLTRSSRQAEPRGPRSETVAENTNRAMTKAEALRRARTSSNTKGALQRGEVGSRTIG